MVSGSKGKNRRSGPVHVSYSVEIRDVKPWPPSQSLRSIRSVLIQWENGDRSSGSTNSVVPSLGSIVGEGKIEFNESFRVPVTLSRDPSAKAADGDVFLKNCLELNLYESRRDKTVKGQSLATGIIDLAEYGVFKESLSVSVPMNCKRSFRNTDRPVLYVTLRPNDKSRNGSSVENGGGESVSALMNEEYAEEAEMASFTDDDVSSHSSVAASSNGGLHTRNEENGNGTLINGTEESNNKQAVALKQLIERANLARPNTPHESMKRIPSNSSSLDLSSDSGSPQNNTEKIIKSVEITNGAEEVEKLSSDDNSQDDEKTKEIDRNFSNNEVNSDGSFDESTEERDLIKKEENIRDKKQNLDGQDIPKIETNENAIKVERLKNVKSVRASNSQTDIKENGVQAEEAQNNNNGNGNVTTLRLKERKEVKVFPRDTRSAILESKMQLLEQRIKTLEGELTEAAAVEASLYSVVAEHGSSSSKVHAPARRLSRMYLHTCRGSYLSRRASAARSAASGLVLAAKACGNDVPRLTFWLSNAVVLRAIISQAAGGSSVTRRNTQKVKENELSPLKWKISSSGKREGIELLNSGSNDWEDPHTFTSALEKIEAWIFSRIVESIWWQTLTPHMQSVDSNEFEIENDSESTKSYNRSFSSAGQEQGSFSLDLWKKAFRDSFDRLCPLRAAGHECGCLPMLPRLVMEQSVSRLDVAMFNAILRDSGDEIPTDPVSDPISDSRVLPIPAGASSFGAGAQLKNAIGNWSRWLTDRFGMDDDYPLEEPNGLENEDERHETDFKSFHLLNALSDLMMLPKDLLLSKSIRKEVCPTFGAHLIKRVLDNFVPDEFCPDPIPDVVFEALESEESAESEEDCATNFPCNATSIVYSPPPTASVASIIGEVGGQAHLRRSGSSVLRKSYTSDDELDELNSPLALILNDGSRSSPVPSTKSGWISKEKNNQNAIRYELLRNVWMEGDL